MNKNIRSNAQIAAIKKMINYSPSKEDKLDNNRSRDTNIADNARRVAADRKGEVNDSSKKGKMDAIPQSNKVGIVTQVRELDTRAKGEINLQKKLQEAIVWSEILGKPVSKRRKRRRL